MLRLGASKHVSGALCPVMERKFLCPSMMASWRYVVAVLSTAGRIREYADKTTVPRVEARVRLAWEAFDPQIAVAPSRRSYAAGRLREAAALDDADQLFQIHLGYACSSPCLFDGSTAVAFIFLSHTIHLAPISGELLYLSALSGEVASLQTLQRQAFDAVALAALKIAAALYLMALWTLTRNEGLAGLSPKELDRTVLESDTSCSLRAQNKLVTPEMPAPVGPAFDRRSWFSCPPQIRAMGQLKIAVRNENATVRIGKKIFAANVIPRYRAHLAVLDPAAGGGERNWLVETGHAVTAPNPGANAPSWELATLPSVIVGANVSWFQRMAVLGTFACNVIGEAQRMKLSHSLAGTQLLED